MFKLLVHPSLLTSQATLNPKTSPDSDASLHGGRRAEGTEGKGPQVEVRRLENTPLLAGRC